MSQKDDKNILQNEELRGLFVFGLLAVLVAYRLADKKILFTLGEFEFSLIPILDVTIILWSLYAFFMVVALSSQEVGESTAKIFRNYSSLVLTMSFIFLAMLLSVIFIVAFPKTWIFVFLLVMLMAVVRLIVGIAKMRVNFSRVGLNGFVEKIKENKWAIFDFVFSMIILFTLLGLITILQDEPYSSILFVIGISDILVHALVNIKYGRWSRAVKEE